MRKPNYVWVEGCDKCENGYTSDICPTCNGVYGLCANPDCFLGEIPVACECNEHPFEEETGG